MKVSKLIEAHEAEEITTIELKRNVVNSIQDSRDKVYGYILGMALSTVPHASDNYYADSFDIAEEATEGVLILMEIIKGNPEADDYQVSREGNVFKIEISAYDGCNAIDLVCRKFGEVDR